MDFKRMHRRHHVKVKQKTTNPVTLYDQNSCLYREPLLEDVTLEELEEFTQERLKLYVIFEKFANSRNWKSNIISSLKSEGLDTYIRLFRRVTIKNENGIQNRKLETQDRRKDYISHFLLRFVFCQSSEMRRYFLHKEISIFRLRNALSKNDIEEFIDIYKLNYYLITKSEKEELQKNVFLNENLESNDFYRIHFIHALSLVKQRQCILHKGYAFVKDKDMLEIFVDRLQDEIEYGLKISLKYLIELEEDERMHHLLNTLRSMFGNRQYYLKTNIISIESIDEVSIKSFPLCMQVAHEHLRTKHHHKYHGRLQYGLFLKGIGVTLEDSLHFWREEFIKKMELERFEKRYAYGIRYNYGLEGRRRSCVPFSCNKILSKSVSFSDTHGCPFKIYNPPELNNLLLKYKLSPNDAQRVVNYAINPKRACECYFNIKHDSKLEISIETPNQYFDLSQQISQLKNDHINAIEFQKNIATDKTVEQSWEKQDSQLFKRGDETTVSLSEDILEVIDLTTTEDNNCLMPMNQNLSESKMIDNKHSVMSSLQVCGKCNTSKNNTNEIFKLFEFLDSSSSDDESEYAFLLKL